jgi:hypothetical protein
MYAGVSPFINRLKAQIYFDDYTLGQIAGFLDGNTGIVYADGDSEETFTGYSKLTEIKYVDEETAVAFLDYVNVDKTGGD